MPTAIKQSRTAAQIAALDIFEKNKYDLKTAFRKSKAWYEQQMILLMKQIQSPWIVLKGNPQQLTTRLMPGKMYMYVYEDRVYTFDAYRIHVVFVCVSELC